MTDKNLEIEMSTGTCAVGIRIVGTRTLIDFLTPPRLGHLKRQKIQAVDRELVESPDCVP